MALDVITVQCAKVNNTVMDFPRVVGVETKATLQHEL